MQIVSLLKQHYKGKSSLKKLYKIMVKRILVSNGEKKKLVDLLETSYPTVRKALAGNLETHIAVKIRTVALERGGVEVEPKK